MNLTGKDLSMRVKDFLQIVQPLPVKYGYTRGVKRGQSFVTYQDMSSTLRVGIGGTLISERKTFTVTVQTKTAEQNLMYSGLIKRGTESSFIAFVSDDLRKDTTVQDGWINTIILSAYNGLEVEQQVFTPDQVRNLLQEIANRYIFVTSIYSETVASSFIDRYIVPQLEDKNYSRAEVLALKQQYLDKLLLATTEF